MGRNEVRDLRLGNKILRKEVLRIYRNDITTTTKNGTIIPYITSLLLDWNVDL